jgi:phosphoribosylamine--glycine ligase
MKILIIGSGGREHALGWKIAQSKKVRNVYIAPGNGGSDSEPKISNINIKNHDELLEFAITNAIDLTIVGPEKELSEGIVDKFESKNQKIFGPTKAGALLESSKKFAKDFMIKNNIPTAFYKTFTDSTLAHQFIDQQKIPLVIKADGLAAGKGVIIARTETEAHEAVDYILEDNKFGDAGSRIIIEEFLEGEEASFIVMTDGEHIFPLASSQDHKRLMDSDKGPNTGGMGAYSPAPIVSDEIHKKIMDHVIEPTIAGLKKEKIPFKGFLYAGLMIKDDEIKVLEFNCRMGDPETQPILFRMKNDLFDLIYDACNNKLNLHTPDWDNDFALTVVMSAKYYPEKPEINQEINGSEYQSDNQYIFHAGTKKENGKIYTNGGRVLGLTGKGKDLQSAFNNAYALTEFVSFNGAFFRKDIGKKALN